MHNRFRVSLCLWVIFLYRIAFPFLVASTEKKQFILRFHNFYLGDFSFGGCAPWPSAFNTQPPIEGVHVVKGSKPVPGHNLVNQVVIGSCLLWGMAMVKQQWRGDECHRDEAGLLKSGRRKTCRAIFTG